jgi:cobalamin synthase
VPHLSSATAAAAATAAYGLITGSFWSIADNLQPWRLAVINVLAVLTMTLWLLFYNHLWDRPADRSERERAVLDNTATLVTLLIGVICMYVILYVISLSASLIVLDSGYLSRQLGHPAGFAGYATITWLACSVGIAAGALGSSFESEEAVRKATYSRREQARRESRHTRDEDGDSGQSDRSSRGTHDRASD